MEKLGLKNSMIVKCDVTDEKAMKEAIEKAEEKFGYAGNI
jgi:hypothetical protein